MAGLIPGMAKRHYVHVEDEDRWTDHAHCQHLPVRHLTGSVPDRSAAPALANPGPASLDTEAVEKCTADDAARDWWRRCSGLHTVEDWVVDYRNHPAGWGALLMIHGVRCIRLL